MNSKASAKIMNLPNWDLTDLYKSDVDPKIEKDLKSLKDRCSKFAKNYKGSLHKIKAKELYAALKEYESISDLVGKISSFSFLYYSTRVTDHKAQAFYQNTEERIRDITTLLIFFSLELNSIDESKIKTLLKDKDLKRYEPYIKDSRVWKPYQLSQIEEEVLHEKNLTSRSAWVRHYEDQTASLKFKFGKQEIGLSEIFNKLSSIDAKTRKDAADSIGEVLGKNISTLSFVYNTLIKDKELEDRRRGFKRPIQSQNLNNLVEDEVVEALISTVKANYKNLSQRYYKIKAKMLGMKVLNYWDRNAALSNVEDKKIPWDEAKKIVLDSYGKFSPKIADIAKMFFDKNWIDAEVKEGKMFGAFSHSTVPSAHPYVMLNYHGKVRDVMTLAHELGHGVHQWLAREQGALMSGTPLTLAETASVFGEQLTFRSILEMEKDKKRRKLIIASKVEDMLNTVVRQIALCEFEKKVHDARREGEISPAKFGKLWIESQKESFGDSVKLDERYENYWSYISHFIHTPFYVYAYAFGDCLVNSLYAVYQNNSVKDFEGKYIEMLKAGGSLRYDEILKPFKLNPKDKKFWQGGLDIISGFIDELE